MFTSTPEITFAELSTNPHAAAHRVYAAPTQSVRIRVRGQEEDDLVLLTARHASDISAAATAMTRLLVGLTHTATLVDVLPHAFPWVRHLPAKGQREFAADLVSVLRTAEDSDNPALVVQRIVEWRHTAEVYADPHVLAALTQEPGDFGEVPEP
jgi:hypothetical protein